MISWILITIESYGYKNNNNKTKTKPSPEPIYCYLCKTFRHITDECKFNLINKKQEQNNSK